MSEIFDLLFEQYSQYQTKDIVLEIIAVVFGLLSVWYSKNNNILVFPTGMISTAIFIYLLYKWVLLGDMMINAYYFLMSIYGWFIWTRKENNTITPISRVTNNEKKIGIIIFLSSLVFVYLIYVYFDKWGTIT
ncbi:MAG: nicotinamide riboside transporter PnuC, partial [Flavobacteriaceae bacterium]